MKKVGKTIKIPKVLENRKPVTSKANILTSDMGSEENKVAKVLVDLISAFSDDGKYSYLMGQSDRGKQFQNRMPRIYWGNSFSKRNGAYISIRTGLMPEASPDLGPGFELGRSKHIVSRAIGDVPVEIEVAARSKEETALFVWALRQIFNSYIPRLIRGTILNESENWQVGLPRKVTFGSLDNVENSPSEADAESIGFYVSTASFEVMYEAMFMDAREKESVKLITPSDAKLTIHPQNFQPSDIKKGDQLTLLLESNENLKDAKIEPENAAILLKHLDKNKLEIFANRSGQFKIIVNSSTLEKEISLYVKD